jgi:hypothetical protein
MADLDIVGGLRVFGPLLGGAFAGLGAYLGVLAASQRGLRALEALLFAANLVRAQATGLQTAGPRVALDYEVALAMDLRTRVTSLLRHVNVTDLPRHVPLSALVTIEALATNQQAMLDRAFGGKANEGEMDRFLVNTVKTLDKETPLLLAERDHLKHWVGVRWIVPTPWRRRNDAS